MKKFLILIYLSGLGGAARNPDPLDTTTTTTTTTSTTIGMSSGEDTDTIAGHGFSSEEDTTATTTTAGNGSSSGEDTTTAAGQGLSLSTTITTGNKLALLWNESQLCLPYVYYKKNMFAYRKKSNDL